MQDETMKQMETRVHNFLLFKVEVGRTYRYKPRAHAKSAPVQAFKIARCMLLDRPAIRLHKIRVICEPYSMLVKVRMETWSMVFTDGNYKFLLELHPFMSTPNTVFVDEVRFLVDGSIEYTEARHGIRIPPLGDKP